MTSLYHNHVKYHISTDMSRESSGRHACVGKKLALQEIRLATAKLVEKYKFRPGENALGTEEYRKAWRDYFTAMPGPNWVKVELRE